jgi:hypothetical protein
VLNSNKDIYQKGYDVGVDEIGEEVEFSDDEKEAEYKRALCQAKRGHNKTEEKQSEPVNKSRINVNFVKQNDENFPAQFPHPIAQLQQKQFAQNQLPGPIFSRTSFRRTSCYNTSFSQTR